MNDIKKLIQMLKEYQKPYIGHDYIFYGIEFCNPQVQMCIEALEKQTPKKVVKAEYDYNCPICGYEYLVNEKYCANCGQKLSWLEVEND